MKIYKTSIGASNLAATGTVGVMGGAINFTANRTIDAGTTTTYIVVIEGAIVDSNSTSHDWSVSLTNLNFGANLDATGFDNIGGALPITETKN